MFTNKTKKTLVKAIVTKKAPLYVQYAVTKSCNLKCRMCGSSASRKSQEDLGLSEIERLSDVLGDLGIGILLLTGGEPFMRKDLPQIIRIFSKKGFTVRLQTNGILASEDKIKAAYDSGIEGVTISLDSLDPEKYDRLTGCQGSWHKIIGSIARFSKVFPTKSSILGINTVVSRQNIDEIPDIIEFTTKIGFYSSVIPVHTSGGESDNFIIRKNVPDLSFRKQDFNKIDKIFKEITALKKRGYNIYNSYRFLKESPLFLKGGMPLWHCDSPDLYFAISPSGNFLPCVDIEMPVSMLDGDFVALYNSAGFKSSVRKRVETCKGCFYACWPEMTFLCRDASVMAERIGFAVKAIFSKRKQVTYEDCLEIIKDIRKD